MNAASLTSIITKWYKKLTLRERRLLLVLGVGFVIIILWITTSWILESKSKLHQSVAQSKSTLSQVLTLAERLQGLENRLTELSTLYMNSSLSYEELTAALDRIIKDKIGSNAYTLNRSSSYDKNDEESSIGNSFRLQKFTIKINEISLEQAVSLLNALESGPPRMFIQRADLSKARNNESLSLSLEVASIETSKINNN